MKDFKNKVAVITGAGSGIGRGLAIKCIQEGMKTVISDLNEKNLERVIRKIKRLGGDCLAVKVDVSKSDEVKELSKNAIDKFGTVDLLFNNAGVAMPRFAWQYTLNDWEWILGVNLWGVIHGIRIFVPIMLEQGKEGYIVNTASIEGLCSRNPGGAIYSVSKHGVVALSEVLKNNLEEIGAKIKVSVLCPGLVDTKIFTSELNRPKEYLDQQLEPIDIHDRDREVNIYRKVLAESPMISPEEVAETVFQAIREEKFYILTHKQSIFKNVIKERMDAILKAFDD
ncbi:MAG: SDR family NAD(P)-dependent oxidoreductase [Candidatus Hodarchaeota archaeon]